MINRIMPLLLGFFLTASVNASNNRVVEQAELDDILGLATELKTSVLYPETEIEYVLTVESRADIHFTRVNPPKGEHVSVRRAGQDHEYYFVDDQEFRISRYYFYLSSEILGELPLEGASLTHVAVDDDGVRRRVRNRALDMSIETLPIPETYQGRWLPSSKVSLDQWWDTEASAFEVGDSIIRTLVLFIDGANVDTFPEFSVQYPDSLSVYSEQPRFDAVQGGTQMTLRQVIVPRTEGELDLPGVAIPWFNTNTNQMQLASIEGFNVNILPNQTETLTLNEVEPVSTVWRSVAIGVTFLWLVTLLGLVRSRWQLKQAAVSADKNSDQECSLHKALVGHDHQKVLKAWNLSSKEIKIGCRQEMDEYLRCYYSAAPQDSEVAKKALLKSLKRIKKSGSGGSRLAPIEP